MAKQIKTYKTLADMIKEHGTIYVRWSRSLAKDRKRGYSLDWSTRTREPGLSVIEITEDDLREGAWWVVRLLTSYSTARYAGGYCRVMLGDIAGHGQDGEPCLDAETIKHLGTVPWNLANELADWAYRDRQRDQAIRDGREHGPRATLPKGWED